MKDYLTNIDECMIYNWRKCQEGQFIYTRKDLTIGDEKTDVLAWELIQDSYYEKFGLGKDYLRVLELQKDIALLQCDLIITNDNFINNKIKRYKRELEEILNRPYKSDIQETLIHITKWLGSPVREKETTVLELYSMLNVMKKEADKQKQTK